MARISEVLTVRTSEVRVRTSEVFDV